MDKNTILSQLKTYSVSDAYPFHMPGHKRNLGEEEGLAGAFPNPFSIDITEISGFDDLHHPEGLLLDSMKHAAAIYGVDESVYLVNGSSGGILAAVSGCVRRGGKILISRNCHKSVYHAVFLNALETEYIYPQFIADLGINGGILPEDVEKILDDTPDIQAVLIVSPTYDGIVSDIAGIAAAAHRKGIPLLVDEAHGAHFPFGHQGEFPQSALDCGADVVIQSLHKTLPSLTQTAILHMKEKFLGREKMERIRWFLTVYQSSSPSYVLMAAAEQCVQYMDGSGRKKLSWLSAKMEQFREKTRDFSSLAVPGRELAGKHGVFDVDLSKIIFDTGKTGKSGNWLGGQFRRKYHLELEMCAPRYALALTSLWDTEEGLARLFRAAADMDRVLACDGGGKISSPGKDQLPRGRTVCPVYQALEMPSEETDLLASSGRIAADYVYLYPPGIPCLVPGEMIIDEIVEIILNYIKIGFDIYGIKSNVGYRLKVLRHYPKNKRKL